MAEVLFVTWDGGGNVAPAVEIARELRARGSHVRFLGQERQREFFLRAGFGFTAYSKPGSWTASDRRGALTNAVGFLELTTGRSLGRDLLAEVEAVPTDIVVVDCLLFGALDAASRTHIPHAVLVHSLYEAIDAKIAGGAPGIVATLRGLRPKKLWADADLVVVATLEELDRPPSPSWPNLRYTGPALQSVPATVARPTSTKVLVSLSTTYLPGQAEVLQTVMDALADLPLSVVVTAGPAVDPSSLHAPANATVHAYLPHSDVMPEASLVIGHGGHSTTMLALAHDLPVLVLPINLVFDQVLVGESLQRAGAGLTLACRSTAGEIRGAVERMLADDSFAIEAARLGAAIREAHGTQAAADLLLAPVPATS